MKLLTKTIFVLATFIICANAKTTQIMPNFTVLSDFGGNVLLVETKEGNILVDSGTAKGAKEIIKIAPNVKYLLTTHRHKDHIGGNDYYGKNRATIIAQKNTAKFIKEKDSGVTKNGYADIIFDDTYNLNVGGEKIELIYYPNAHTNGDYVVYFPKRNIIHVADISFGSLYNYLDTNYGATIDGLINATQKIIDLINDDTLVIPGHGGVTIKKADLKRNLAMYKDVKNKIQELKNKGMSLEEVIKAKPTAKYDSSYSWSFITPEKFITPIYNTLP